MRTKIILCAALFLVAPTIAAAASTDDRGAPQPDSIVSLDTALDTGDHVDMVLDAAGNPVISYFDATNGDLRVLRCTNPDCSGTQTAVSPDPDSATNVVGLYTSIALTSTNMPVIAYADQTTGELKVLACNTVDCSGPQDATGFTAGGPTSISLELAGDAPVVVFQDNAAGGQTLGFLRCEELTCGHTVMPITLDAQEINYPSLALDAAGNPVIAYFYLGAGDLRLIHCDDPRCSGTEPFEVPDDDIDAGLFPSVRLDQSGNPVIAYYVGNLGLRLLTCSNPECSGTQTPIDITEVTGGQRPSLVLDDAGHPVISYSSFPGDDLGLLRCVDATCADTDRVVFVPDGPDEVGSDSAIALDADDQAVVAYYDSTSTNKDLKLLHCYDSFAGCGWDPIPTGPIIPAACPEVTYVTLEGTGRADNLVGTPGNDLIFARGGDDVVDGRGGRDCIVGGRGRDTLRGGRGGDVLLGGKGRDTLLGGRGRDLCLSGSSADRSCERVP
jgi:hypothetical protein